MNSNWFSSQLRNGNENKRVARQFARWCAMLPHNVSSEDDFDKASLFKPGVLGRRLLPNLLRSITKTNAKQKKPRILLAL